MHILHFLFSSSSPIASFLTLPKSLRINSAILSMFFSSKTLYSNNTEALFEIENSFHSLKALFEEFIVFSIIVLFAQETMPIFSPLFGLNKSMLLSSANSCLQKCNDRSYS